MNIPSGTLCNVVLSLLCFDLELNANYLLFVSKLISIGSHCVSPIKFRPNRPKSPTDPLLYILSPACHASESLAFELGYEHMFKRSVFFKENVFLLLFETFIHTHSENSAKEGVCVRVCVCLYYLG